MKLDDRHPGNSGYITTHCNNLTQFIHCLTGESSRSLVTICAQLLHNPPYNAHEMKTATGLNWNQFPLQFVISHQKKGVYYKILGDPAFYITDPLCRYRQSMKALSHILEMGHAQSLYDICKGTIAATLPDSIPDLQEYTYGVMWLGLSLSHPGAAVYVLSVLDTKIAWHKAHRLADTILSDSEEMHRIITSLEPGCRLASVGIEGSTLKNARVKLYWRVSTPTSFQNFGIPLYSDDSILRFFGTLLNEHFFTLSALTFSAGFNLITGKVSDIKIDISNRIMHMDFDEAITFVQKAARSLDFDNAIPRKWSSCSHDGMEVAFIGIGMDKINRYRLHMYIY